MPTLLFINSFIAQNVAMFTFMGVLGGIFVYWKNGGFSMNKNIIDSFRVRVDQLQADVSRLTASDAEKGKEIGKLQGIIQGKDQQISMMQSILQNRNPEMQNFMNLMTESLKNSASQQEQSAQYMKDSRDVFQQIVTYMQENIQFMKKLDSMDKKIEYGTDILDQQEERSKQHLEDEVTRNGNKKIESRKQ